jgi:hypothetical protein
MAPKPHPANVPGDFYVEDGCCTMCTLPFAEAPDLIGEARDPSGEYFHCFVKRQPQSQLETEQMLSAIAVAELKCFRYRGIDRQIMSRLVETDEGDVCDNLPEDLAKLAREREAEWRRVRTKPHWKALLGWLFRQR